MLTLRCQPAPWPGPLHGLLESLERSSPDTGGSLTLSRRPTLSKRNGPLTPFPSATPPPDTLRCPLACQQEGRRLRVTREEPTKHLAVAFCGRGHHHMKSPPLTSTRARMSSLTSSHPKDDASELRGAGPQSWDLTGAQAPNVSGRLLGEGWPPPQQAGARRWHSACRNLLAPLRTGLGSLHLEGNSFPCSFFVLF